MRYEKIEVPPVPELRKFGITFAAIVAILFGLALPLLTSLGWMVWPWIVAAIFTGWALLAPSTLALFYRFWMRLGLIMNAVMSPLILGIVYFLLITPLSFIMRAVGQKPIKGTIDKDASTYRVVRDNEIDMGKPY